MDLLTSFDWKHTMVLKINGSSGFLAALCQHIFAKKSLALQMSYVVGAAVDRTINSISVFEPS